MYSSWADRKATIYYFKDSICQPEDGLLQIWKIDNTTLSLTGHTDSNRRFNNHVMWLNTNLYRTFEISLSNEKYVNFENPGTVIVHISTNINTRVILRDSVISNVTSELYHLLIRLQLSGSVLVENVLFENITVDGTQLIHFDRSYDNVTFKNITLRNYTDVSSNLEETFLFGDSESTVTLIDGIYATDLYFREKNIITSTTNLDKLQIMNCIFDTINMDSSNYLINTGTLKSLEFMNNTISNLEINDNSSTEGTILYISSLDLQSEANTFIDNVAVDNAKTSLLSFGTFVNSPPSYKYVNITNVNFTNTNFDIGVALISTEGIELEVDVRINLSGLMFSNITFLAEGTLIESKQQLSSYLTITDSQFINLDTAILKIESSNTLNSDLSTLVQINNTLFDNISNQFHSFININEGGWLEINNCSFTNIVSYQNGAVISSGFRQTTTLITDTHFTNNTAIQGGVFSIQDESVIKCYNCIFTNNFAPASGVIRVAENGYFEIYNSQIYNNFASQNPISELFDSAITSIIDSTSIYNNTALSHAQILSEFTSSCENLCFIPETYKTFTLESSSNYFSVQSNYLFALISGSISIQNNSKIMHQSSILNLFLSTAKIENATIQSITAVESVIKAANSVIFVNDTKFDMIDNNLAHDLMFITLDSELYVDNVTLLDSNSNFVNARTTLIRLSNVSLSNVTSHIQIIKIDASADLSINQISLLNTTTLIDEQILISASK